MYTVNIKDKRILPIRKVAFSSLGLTERNDLQEWLAHSPSALGQDLLIIQKEFDGFDETRERLDLLALDKKGNLVVIENKLDDSGRDVIWQAIKYASYCATLTKPQILDIYAAYLKKIGNDSLTAKDSICEFLEVEDLAEVQLNRTNSQRLIFVAANFRKEVTSSAIWLLNQGIDIQCFEVSLYQRGEEDLFFDVDQLIPTPSTEDLLISMKKKRSEEEDTEHEKADRERIREAYWSRALTAFKESSCDLFNGREKTGKDHWLSAGSGVGGCPFSLVFMKSSLRVELSLARQDKDENKAIFDQLFNQKETIEAEFGEPLEWMRLDEKQMSRISFTVPANGYDETQWPKFISWHIEYMSKLEKALRRPLLKAGDLIKHGM